MQRAWRMNHRPASRLEADTAPSPQAKAIRSQATLTSRSHTLTMAMHAPLSQFLARLDTDLGAGTGGEFLAATPPTRTRTRRRTNTSNDGGKPLEGTTAR